MGFKLGDLFIKLSTDKKDFDKGLNEAKQSTNAFASSMKKIGGAIAGVFAADQIFQFAKQSVMAYDTAAKAEQALLTALKNRIDIQRNLIKQANELQGKTLFSDDETIRAQSLLAAFIKEEDQIKVLIPLIQDFATAKQMDLASAADLVTKTFAGEMNALGRYGIQVEGSAGSAERLTMIQKGLNDAFGGQAEAAAKVGTGALKILANEYDNLQEVIGKLIISQQNQQGSFTKFVTSMTKGLTNFLGKVSTWSDAGFSFSQSLVAAFASSDEETEKLAESLQVVEKADQKTKDSIISNGEQVHKTYKQQLDDIIEINKALEAEKEAQRILRKEFKGEKVSEIPTIGTPSKLQSTSPDTRTLANMDGYLNSVSEKRKQWTEEELQGWNDFTADLNQTISEGLADAIGNLATGFGEMMGTGNWDWSNFGAQLLDGVGRFMQTLGGLFIAYGIANLKFVKALLAGPTPLGAGLALAAGIGLVAAGSAISSFAKKGFSGSAASTTPASGYSNYSQSTAGNVLNGNVVFELQGTMLKGVLNNVDRKNQLIR